MFAYFLWLLFAKFAYFYPTAGQQRPKNTKPKTSITSVTTTPAQDLPLDKQSQLKSLENNNRQLQLENNAGAIKKTWPSPLENLRLPPPLGSSDQNDLAEDEHIPTLKDPRSKDKKECKHPSLLLAEATAQQRYLKPVKRLSGRRKRGENKIFRAFSPPRSLFTG